MNQIEVCISPALLPYYELKNKVVVVTDVLRATSSMVSALDAGVKAVIPVDSRKKAREFFNKENYFVAGERDGKKVDGFDFGNSPLVFQENKEILENMTLVMTTTNGTKAIQSSLKAEQIIIGALNNVRSTAEYISRNIQRDIIVVCAGWKNRVNIEDTLFAGALCKELESTFEIYGDAALMSAQYFDLQKVDLLNCIKKATHYKRLKQHGIEEDIKFCMTLNNSNTVAILKEDKIVKV